MRKHPAKHSAFISYASDDREKADDICAGLEDRGFTCWIAPRNVRAGREYADEIISGIERSACVVLVLSQAANNSVFVRREVERAVSKHKPIFPVRIDEVMPSPGLELFVSGTHWLDAWTGDWDDHMAHLAQEVASVPAGKPPTEVSSGRLPLSDGRGFRGAVLAAAIVFALALGGAGFWAFSAWRSAPQGAEPQTERSGSEAPNREEQSDTSVTEATPPPQGQGVEAQVQEPSVQSGGPQVRPRVQAGDRVAAPASAAVNPAPPVRAAAEAAAPSPAASRELNLLRDEYDELLIRGETVDDTLNQLWEEMRPLPPRVDMATRQRSLRTYLARSRDAIAEKNAADARRYLDNARSDLAALEQFLGR